MRAHLFSTAISRRDSLRWLGVCGTVLLSGCAGEGSVEIAAPQTVSGCRLDPARLTPLKACMESSGPTNPSDDWNHSCIHPQTLAYSCGRLTLPGGTGRQVHDHDPRELLLCDEVAGQAAALMQHVEFTSEAGSPLLPFFITANRGDSVPDSVTPELIRRAFGGVIYPQADIIAQPAGQWILSEIERQRQQNAQPPEAADGIAMTSPSDTASKPGDWSGDWRRLVDWLSFHPDLHGAAYVEIGDGEPMSRTNFGCVFPRLWIGITKQGSLTGICGFDVET